MSKRKREIYVISAISVVSVLVTKVSMPAQIRIMGE